MRLTLLFLLLPLSAVGQEIQFTADTSSGNGQVVPVLTWSTVPAADSCVASGNWTGEKGAIGIETLAAISGSATYNLTCTWPADDDVDLQWTNPTLNTDGSTYTDKGWTVIEYSPDGVDPWFLQVVAAPDATSTIVPDLAAGDWFFRAYAVNINEVSSDASGVATKIVESSAEAQESIGITVNPKPSPPTGLVAQ